MHADDIAAVRSLLDVAEAADGHRPLGEHQWLDLVHGGRRGFAGLVAWEPGHDHPVGYAQLTLGVGDSWALEYVIDPHHRAADGLAVGTDLVRAATASDRSVGFGTQTWTCPARTRTPGSRSTTAPSTGTPSRVVGMSTP